MGVGARKATYSATGSWSKLVGTAGEMPAGLSLREPPRTASVLYVARAALRCDFVDQRAGQPTASLIRTGGGELFVLDHESRTVRALQLARGREAAAALDDANAETTEFGPARWLVAALSEQAELRIGLLEAEFFPALEAWWRLLFGAAVAGRHRFRLPFAYELRRPAAAEPLVRIELLALEDVELPESFFRPPSGFRLDRPERGSRDLRPRPAPRPQGREGMPRESAIGALLSGVAGEQVKLQLRDEVVERVRSAVNDVSARLGIFTGERLVVDLQPLFTYLAAAGPRTPAGMPAIADRLLIRALFVQIALRIRRVFEVENLRDALLRVITAVGNVFAGSIEPTGQVSAGDLETFRSVRDLVVASPGRLLPLLDSVRTAEIGPVDQLNALMVSTISPGDPQEFVARAWFDHAYRHISLQPAGGIVQRDGRNRGWRENELVAEGLGELIDLELEVRSVTIDFANQAVLGASRPIDETDARFALIDSLSGTPPSSTIKRAGFVTQLAISELRASADLRTQPTTRSAVIAVLLLTQPQELFKLWNWISLGVEIGGLTADVIVYLEQDRLSPAAPSLKVWIGPLEAASLNVSGVVQSADPLVQTVGTLVVNTVLDLFSPALIDEFANRLGTAFDKVIGALEELAFGQLNPNLAPRPPRTGTGVTTAVQQMTSVGFTLRDEIRLQPLLNLNREDVFERLPRIVDERQNDWNAAFAEQDRLWQQHVRAAEEAKIDLTAAGFNPRTQPRPITNPDGAELTEEQIDALDATYFAWFDQRAVVDAAEAELREAQARLRDFLDNWPEGQTACEVVGEPDGYRIGLGICVPAAPVGARALVHPSIGVGSTGDLTLLVSARVFHELTSGTGFSYRGEVRDTDGSPAVLAQLPAIDWWQDAPDPALLGARPIDLRDGPPPLPPGPSTDESEWRGYWSMISVGGRSATLIPRKDPTPDQHVAEILVGVTVHVGVTTFEAVVMERCGPDLTRLAGELEHPRLGDPGRFRPPVGPGGPDPRPGRPVWIEAEVGVHRAASALEPRIVTARDLEDTRVRFVAPADGGGLADVGGVFFSRPGLGGALGGAFGGDAHCQVLTAWDVKEREEWLRARIELRLPVYVGLSNVRPERAGSLPREDAIGNRARQPVLTYRYDPEPLTPYGPFTLETGGPLTGLAEGANRGWLETLLANHALALVRNSVDPHRLTGDNPLYYAYGLYDPIISLVPEGFAPYAMLALHPTHWAVPVPPPLDDREPPYVGLETFGPPERALNLAVKFFVVESLLDKLGA